MLSCALETWSPGIGDPTIWGWLTVALYLVTAVSAFSASRAPFRLRPGVGRERLFWGGIAVIMLFLAANKQLDLQSFMTAYGRCTAVDQGWYEDRRSVQLIFIMTLLTWSAIAAFSLVVLLWGRLARLWPAALGLVVVMGFVAIRAVGFHGTDALINLTIGGVPVNLFLEAIGPLLITSNARAVRRTAVRTAPLGVLE
ncbi:MAG: isopropylmalate isomerase [Pseudomonadota bacterium]